MPVTANCVHELESILRRFLLLASAGCEQRERELVASIYSGKAIPHFVLYTTAHSGKFTTKHDMNDEQIEQLKKNSIMLGQIAGYVYEWCDENTTTLEGVILMKAELLELKARILRDEVDSRYDSKMQ